MMQKILRRNTLYRVLITCSILALVVSHLLTRGERDRLRQENAQLLQENRALIEGAGVKIQTSHGEKLWVPIGKNRVVIPPDGRTIIEPVPVGEPTR